MSARPVEELLPELVEKRGAVVSSADCSEMEIAFANAEGRLFVDENGLGYVLRTRIWRERAQRAVEADPDPTKCPGCFGTGLSDGQDCGRCGGSGWRAA